MYIFSVHDVFQYFITIPCNSLFSSICMCQHFYTAHLEIVTCR